jgi:hypothetical protein
MDQRVDQSDPGRAARVEIEPLVDVQQFNGGVVRADEARLRRDKGEATERLKKIMSIGYWRSALVSTLALLALLIAPSAIVAQDRPLRSALTGIELPAGAKPEGGFLNRAAARLTMSMSVQKEGAEIGSELEMYKLAPTAGAFDGYLASLGAQGWTVTRARDPTETWALVEKGGKRFITYVVVSTRETMIYFADTQPLAVASNPAAERSTARPSTAPPGMQPPHAPASGDAASAHATTDDEQPE